MYIFPKIAIIGCTNAGKSTLFNRLILDKLAIVSDVPGTTRDFNEYIAEIGDYKCYIIDTAGWEFATCDPIASGMRQSTIAALQNADFAIFLVDGKKELSANELELSKIIKQYNKKAILAVNKSESNAKPHINDLYKLGFGEPIYISAEHKLGFQELFLALIDELEILANCSDYIDLRDENEDLRGPQPVFSLVGRPNVGKSTLFNKIIGSDRSIVSEVAGTTRDVIRHKINFQNKEISFLDTAGMRKKSKIIDDVEGLCISQTKSAIMRSHVLALVVSAEQMFEKQDLAIAQLVIDAGKALIIIINKCDLIKDIEKLKQEAQYNIKKYISGIYSMPVIFTSGLTESFDSNDILQKMMFVYSKYQFFCSTGKLNKWLNYAITKHTPPKAANNRQIKFKYITQTKVRPPTFTVFTNTPKDINAQYERYLIHSLLMHFDICGVPIRFLFKQTNNPYAKSKT